MQASKNKMGTVPVNKLLISMGVPMMLSMIVQALYNVVDSLFVSHIPGMGDSAINALALAFPIQMLMTAVCVGTGVGVNSSLSKSLGMGDQEKAGRIASNSLLLSLCYYLVMLFFGLFLVPAFLSLQSGDELVLNLGADYLRIITICSFGTIGYMCFEKLLQATGKTTEAMAGQLVGALTNIVLDPIMIFGYFGLPAMGVKGAAAATILGQVFSFIAVLYLHLTRNKEATVKRAYMAPRRAIIGEIYKVGGPAIVMQSLTSFMTFGMNIILGSVSASAVVAYGIYYKLQNFIFMPCFGLNNASVPIISFNYGARSKERIKSAIRYGLLYVWLIMLLGTLLLQLFAHQIVGCFSLSSEASALCVLALRIITVGFVFAGTNIILQGVCQALGNGVYSLIISLLRLVAITLPLAKILSGLENAATVIWVSFPAAEITACVVASFLAGNMYRKRTKGM